MDIIGSIKLLGEIHFMEVDYHYFILDLSAKLGDVAQVYRDGLEKVNQENANQYIEFMKRYALDLEDLEKDYRSLSVEEQFESESSFFPTVLVDFDEKTFYSAHPDDYYLNFRDYLPCDWKYVQVDSLRSAIPEKDAYWVAWSLR